MKVSHYLLSFVISSIACGFLLIGSTSAEVERKLSDMSLEELLNVKVISATRQEVKAFELPAIVTILTGEELADFGAENLADGLKFASGITIRKSPGDFPQYKAFIRGNTSDFLNERTLFLIDGVPLFNPNAGFDPGWMPIAMIKRVEIVKGPVSSLYGANAFGGVINVITKSGADIHPHWVEVELGGKERRDLIRSREIPGYSGSLNLGHKGTNWDYFLSGQEIKDHNSSNSFGQNYQSLFGRTNYQLNDRFSFGIANLLTFHRNQIAETNAPEPIENDLIHLTGTAKLKFDHSDLQITGLWNRFQHFLDYSDALDKYDNKGQVLGVNSQFSSTLRTYHQIIFGVEYAYLTGSLTTNEFDYSVSPPSLKSAGWGSHSQNTYAIFGQYQYSGWEKLKPLIGLRADFNSVYGNALSPRLGLSYAINDSLSVYASVGRAFRAPVFNESYIQGFGKIGNTDLSPETTTTYELGLKTAFEMAKNSISIFRQDISDKISPVKIDPNNSSSLSKYQNGADANIMGLEMEGSFKPIRQLQPFYNLMLLTDDDGTGTDSDKIINRKIVVGTILDFFDCELKYVLVHEGNQFYYNTNAAIPSDSSGRVFYPSITVMNAQVAKNFGKWGRLTLFANNLTNQKYKEGFSSFIIQDSEIMPGFTFGARLSARF